MLDFKYKQPPPPPYFSSPTKSPLLNVSADILVCILDYFDPLDKPFWATIRMTHRCFDDIAAPHVFAHIKINHDPGQGMRQMTALTNGKVARFTGAITLNAISLIGVSLPTMDTETFFAIADLGGYRHSNHRLVKAYLRNNKKVWKTWMAVFTHFINVAPISAVRLELDVQKSNLHSRPDAAAILWEAVYDSLIPVILGRKHLVELVLWCTSTIPLETFFAWKHKNSNTVSRLPSWSTLEMLYFETEKDDRPDKRYSPSTTQLTQDIVDIYTLCPCLMDVRTIAIDGFRTPYSLQTLTRLEIAKATVYSEDLCSTLRTNGNLQELILTDIVLTNMTAEYIAKAPMASLGSTALPRLGVFFSDIAELQHLVHLALKFESVQLAGYLHCSKAEMLTILTAEMAELRGVLSEIRKRRDYAGLPYVGEGVMKNGRIEDMFVGTPTVCGYCFYTRTKKT